MSELQVYFEDRIVGSIAVGPGGAGFDYDPDWRAAPSAFPISLRMPLVPGAYGPEVLMPWAENLLPESDNLRLIGRNLGVAPADTIGILARIGRDTAGALSIGGPGTRSPASWRRIDTAADLERIIEELPRKPFLAGEDGVSMSLAGVQSKIGVGKDDAGTLYVPLDGAPSTHILKPNAKTLFGSVQNEALCLTLAALCGIDTPEVTTGIAGARSYLLVARYDRAVAEGGWRRMHQEDFCQILGKPPAAKYETNLSGIPGPTLADMIDAARQYMAATDVLRIVDYIIFNVVVGNTDAHAKNYSALTGPGGPRLAPLYDVIHASQWEGITPNLAQTVAGKARADHIKGYHWQRMARQCGLNPAALLRRVAALAGAIGRHCAAAESAVIAMPAGGHVMLPRFRDGIETRAARVLTNLADTQDRAEDDDV